MKREVQEIIKTRFNKLGSICFYLYIRHDAENPFFSRDFPVLRWSGKVSCMKNFRIFGVNSRMCQKMGLKWGDFEGECMEGWNGA